MISIDSIHLVMKEIGYKDEYIEKHFVKEVQHLSALIPPNEPITMILSAVMYNEDVWLAILTKTRILLAANGLFKCKQEIIPLQSITSVIYRPGNLFIHSKIILQQNGKEKCFKTEAPDPFEKDAIDFAKKFTDRLNELLLETTSSATGQIDSIADELLKLKELLDANLLTHDEFKEHKKKLLGR